MPTIIDGTTGVTFPAGGVGNPAGAVVGTTDTQTLTNKSIAATQLTGNIAAARITDALNASGSAPVYACRAWVNFNGTTSPGTIRASGNVSSVTTSGTGLYEINFTTAMPDANYSTMVTASSQVSFVNDGSGAACVNANFTPTTSAVRVMTFGVMNSAGDNRWSVFTSVAIFR
jgi:hypothetical protein